MGDWDLGFRPGIGMGEIGIEDWGLGLGIDDRGMGLGIDDGD